MLPPGHIAAGYLAATVYESIFHPAITINQSKNLLWIGALSGFVPDIDMFFAFLKVGAWRIDIKSYVFFGILGLKEKQLGYDDVCNIVIYWATKENDVFFQKTRVNIIGALAEVGLFYDGGN